MTGRQVWSSHFRRASLCTRYTSRLPPYQRRHNTSSTATDEKDDTTGKNGEAEGGAMSRRLSQMTEDAMLEGGRSARRNIEQSGFSEDLKSQLEERIKAAEFRSEHAAAHSILSMPSSAGQGSREMATAAPWTGTESIYDSNLRMLDDASKPIRMPYRIPQPVNLKPSPKPKLSHGARLAEAKERTSTYTLTKSPGFSDEQRESMRREMREKLLPGAHSMPISLSGFASLANERIEDAIARGQFQNIKRGKGVNTETDHNANSAYIDTTEYFMNKIIQKQEIVPPWIEKQQELSSEISRFRQRLRVDWKRHAARLISSQGGSLDEKMKRARAYAAAEVRLKEKAKLEAALLDTQNSISSEAEISEITTDGRIVSKAKSITDEPSIPPEELEHLPPLRDPQYMLTERAYLELAVKQINNIARSYNLQAPRAAQKPYLNLERELNSCFADSAPALAEEIRRRATERARGPTLVTRTPGVFGSLSPGPPARVYDEDKTKGYGFKEFWRDLFSKERR